MYASDLPYNGGLPLLLAEDSPSSLSSSPSPLSPGSPGSPSPLFPGLPC